MAAVVIDNGSGLVKCGFDTETKPTSVFPSIIGRPRISGLVLGENAVIVGEEAQKKRGILSLRYPVEHGIVVNWDDMETLWQHTFRNELRIDPSEYPVVITEAALNPKNNRERTLRALFETFGIQSLNMVVCPIVSLFATGRTSGIILECGDGVTHTVPIYEGYIMPHAILRLDLAGRDLTDRLCQLLGEKGLQFTTVAEREVVREIKEKLCYVAEDFTSTTRDAIAIGDKGEEAYELPDGQTVNIGSERFKCPEALFQPQLIGLEQQGGIHNLVYDSIRKCDMDIRRQYYRNVVLAGGTTLFRGLSDRLRKEVGALAPKSVNVRVVALKERRYGCWLGASILAGITTFRKEWITKAEYEEFGAEIIHKRCP